MAVYTHRDVSYRVAGGKVRTRNIKVHTEGDIESDVVRAEVVDVLAVSHSVAPTQISLTTDAPPRKGKQVTAADIRGLKKSELIDLINKDPELRGIDTDGTNKAMEDAIIDRKNLPG